MGCGIVTPTKAARMEERREPIARQWLYTDVPHGKIDFGGQPVPDVSATVVPCLTVIDAINEHNALVRAYVALAESLGKP